MLLSLQWNVSTGTGEVRFLLFFFSILFDFLPMNRPSILVLVGTKVQSSTAHVIIQKSLFPKVIATETNSFSEGI